MFSVNFLHLCFLHLIPSLVKFVFKPNVLCSHCRVICCVCEILLSHWYVPVMLLFCFPHVPLWIPVPGFAVIPNLIHYIPASSVLRLGPPSLLSVTLLISCGFHWMFLWLQQLLKRCSGSVGTGFTLLWPILWIWPTPHVQLTSVLPTVETDFCFQG